MSTTDTITINTSSSVTDLQLATDITDIVISDFHVDGSTISASPYYSQNWNVASPGNLVITDLSSDENKSDIYVCEEWESKKPIKIKEGMFVSFKDDLYSVNELEDMVLKKIEDEYPEALIKMGLNKDSINIKKHSIPIEIRTKD